MNAKPIGYVIILCALTVACDSPTSPTTTRQCWVQPMAQTSPTTMTATGLPERVNCRLPR